MKLKLTLLLSLTFLFLFSGCSGNGDDDHDEHVNDSLNYSDKVTIGLSTQGSDSAIKELDNDEYKFFTEISMAKENEKCGSIKYSILNLGVDAYGGNNDHIKIMVLNVSDQSGFEKDSTSFIKLACKDITNDGRPELVIDTWGGGNAACVNDFHILSSINLEGKLHTQVLLSAEGFNGIEDVDGDGISEVITCQWNSYGKKGNTYLNQTKCLRNNKYVDCVSKLEGRNDDPASNK
jgi:hypothetical protein